MPVTSLTSSVALILIVCLRPSSWCFLTDALTSAKSDSTETCCFILLCFNWINIRLKPHLPGHLWPCVLLHYALTEMQHPKVDTVQVSPQGGEPAPGDLLWAIRGMAKTISRQHHNPLAVFPAISCYWARENIYPSVMTERKGITVGSGFVREARRRNAQLRTGFLAAFWRVFDHDTTGRAGG